MYCWREWGIHLTLEGKIFGGNSVEIVQLPAYSQSVVIYANKSLSRFFLFFVYAFFDDNVVEIIRTKLISP